MQTRQTLCVIGLGYIGLPTAALFADRGLRVIGVDVNSRIVDTVNQGHVHIVEPGLEELVARIVGAGKLRAAIRPEVADFFLIAVPTPFTGDAHEPDLRFILSAAEDIAPVLKPGDCVILESTSPVGTTEMLAACLQKARPDLRIAGRDTQDCDIFVAYCPERALPGRTLGELTENSRVIGGINPASTRRAKEAYGLLVRGYLLETSARTAEMVKLTENSFRDVNIAFANELSLICEQLDIPVRELIRLANHHPRVNILNPGPGVGGHCISVDPWFIVSRSPDLARLIRTAREVNDGKPGWVVQRALAATESLRAQGKTKKGAVGIAVFGLSFKPDIDDLRESPALGIATILAEEKNIRLLIVEPHIPELPESLRDRQNVEWTGMWEAMEQANILLFLVGHSAFKELAASLPEDKIIMDTVGIL
jgi:UDP-N-acetyl-D-mannosaminuronic acid dehydrogenase